MNNKQKTLNGSFSLFGKGLHTGLSLTVTFNPAPENYGYKIQRIDLPGEPIIDAIAENVTETTRGTVLTKGEARVSTVEHAMAALFASGIDNCLMQVNGPEFPILDGSAIQYVQNIERIGLKEQNAEKDTFIIKSKIEIKDENTGNSIIILPDDKFSLNVLVHYDSGVLYNQYATLEDMEDFKEEIASSRTFVFVRELEPLLAAGLIKGGDLDNAIVIYEREMPQERYNRLADVMGVPHMDATKLGYLNHKPLVWNNEPARHKLLDIIGDLALIGKPLCAGTAGSGNQLFTAQFLPLCQCQTITVLCFRNMGHLGIEAKLQLFPQSFVDIGQNTQIVFGTQMLTASLEQVEVIA